MLIWLWAVLALLFLIDALRVRGRLNAIAVLSSSEEPVSPEHVILVAPGVSLDDATRRAASAHARANGLGVLDLVPGNMGVLAAWGLLQFLDPPVYRKDILGKGVSAGHAAVVTKDVLARSLLDAATLTDEVAFVRAVGRLKWYASASTDLAIAPGLRAVRSRRPLAVLRERTGGGADFVLLGVPIILALLVAAGVTGSWPGLAAVVAFHLQPVVAFAGSRLRVSGLVPVTLFRFLVDVWGWLVLLFESAPSTDPKVVDALRPEYAKILSAGTAPFFEPPRETCPLCDAADLRREVQMGDLLQGKPGRFRLDRCRACGHVFQNPRLSFAGLDFYYKDFYDGLGGDEIEAIFGASLVQYHQRAESVQAVTTPSKWLDVGGGHGHLCRILKDRLPGARFDGLDLSESIEDAERRGWVDRGYRGLFPEKAEELRGQYDVVSMSHYLEHTREPEAEIEAAEKTLSEGGILMIEVPDPDCPLRRLLGRLWLPYFQPQHQHLVSTKNLEGLLRKHGFTPLAWHRGRAHQRIDILAATILFFHAIAPRENVPWRPRSLLLRVWRNFCFVAGFPLLLITPVIDHLIGPLAERFDWSNTYRVVARKGTAPALSPDEAPSHG